MMYNKQFVATVKVAGQVLREDQGKIQLPFGSEYSIFLKNLSTKRAIVNIEIDGKDIGGSLVVSSKQSIDLERFLGNNEQGNRFKFIERTSSVEDFRGIGSEDGLIRIEFAYEKARWHNSPETFYRKLDNSIYGSTLRSASFSDNHAVASACSMTPQAAGITAPGSVSNQKFSTTSSFATEDAEVIVLQLLGYNGAKPVIAPVTVKHKPTCVTCGKVNKANSKFCSNCGTSLIII